MARVPTPKVDALLVEGPDDGVVVNALVEKRLGVDIAGPRLVRTKAEGAGFEWVLAEFEKLVRERQPNSRIGAIVDRDRDAKPDRWDSLRAVLRRLGYTGAQPERGGIIHDDWGVWMWPHNAEPGDLEDFVAGIVPASATLTFAGVASRTARESHAAEYDLRHERKATLKVRSVWHDATTAGGYGHMLRALHLNDTDAARDFASWFTRLFLT